jgi:hypothetical protein
VSFTTLSCSWGTISTNPRTKDCLMPRRRNSDLERLRHRLTLLVHIAAVASRYLAKTSPLLNHVASVLINSLMRPEEIFRIRWEHINWTSGRYCMVVGDSR